MKFKPKKTLIRNIGLLVKSTFSIILFMIGLNAITGCEDQVTTLFLLLIWCYIFLTHWKFRPVLIFEDKKGRRVEEW